MHENFLFDPGYVSPRDFNESRTQCESALRCLRAGPLTKLRFEQAIHKYSGCRLAPAIDILKNGWGFDITGTGTRKNPYRLTDRQQWPMKVQCTDAMKDAYYETEHWVKIRQQRWEHDNYRCVICPGLCESELQCHHICYSLFDEHLGELITVCKDAHELIHDNCRLKFPTGVCVSHAEILLGVVQYAFEDWLKP